MVTNIKFSRPFQSLLPETYELLKSGNLTVHDSVISILLHGSRGLRGGAKATSDIDLSIIVDQNILAKQKNKSGYLGRVTRTTLDNWCSKIELDLAVVYDIRHCGLKCFHQRLWYENLCSDGGTDCFGLYKIQKGIKRIVINAGVQVKLMFPCLEIWNKKIQTEVSL